MAKRVSGFLGGRLLLAQDEGGHRAGTDAALLVAATPREVNGLLLDVGAGVGGRWPWRGAAGPESTYRTD